MQQIFQHIADFDIPSPRDRHLLFLLLTFLFTFYNLPSPSENLKINFQNLRTIIVIADVHWRFGDWLAPLPLTFQHWSGVSPYTSPCGFAETCVFGKQSLGQL